MRSLYILLFLITLTTFSSCARYYEQCCDEGPALACVNLIDWEGSQTTIRSDERLKMHANTDFLAPQPYQKILRVYKRDECGDSYSYVTSYHPNGMLNQYLEVRNSGVFGAYREFHENGEPKLECQVIAGTPELTVEAQKNWKFDGLAEAWDDCGNLIATYNYCKGSLEGESFKYYPDGTIKLRTPYARNLIHGAEEMFYPDGSLMASAEWEEGNLEGHAERHWPSGQLASEEEHQENRLVNATYFNPDGEVIATITNGKGQRAIFEKENLFELQQYNDGVPAGEVKVFSKRGFITKIYEVKNGLKHGQEQVFYQPPLGVVGKDSTELYPQLLISWHQGKVHGISKSWYPNGVMESQREMSNNRRNGIATAWYRDGSMMLMEEYTNDKLTRGEYFRKGNTRPESRVTDGDGTATLYNGDGLLLRKVNYFHGFVLD